MTGKAAKGAPLSTGDRLLIGDPSACECVMGLRGWGVGMERESVRGVNNNKRRKKRSRATVTLSQACLRCTSYTLWPSHISGVGTAMGDDPTATSLEWGHHLTGLD